jgi:Raf kinase inhibitor-like YbhB/YbcL family protein
MRRCPVTHRVAAVIVAAAFALTACGDRSGRTLDDPVFPPPAPPTVPTTAPPPTAAAAPLTLVSPWVDGAEIPERYTCAGDGVSPALTWSNVPVGTIELALSVVDLDADRFVNWLVYGIAPFETGLIEAQIPAGAFLWPTSMGTGEWLEPCPPAGRTHRYQFTVYALNQQLEAADDAAATEVLSILDATTIAQSSITGFTTGVP